jgi:hypothetical protein
MGYDLHITRTADWTQSSTRAITIAEWHDQITWDPDLRLDSENGPNSAHWVDSAGTVLGWLDWADGAVYTTDPDHATVGKLLEIAERLGARVQGDRGEFYETLHDWLPSAHPALQPPAE